MPTGPHHQFPAWKSAPDWDNLIPSAQSMNEGCLLSSDHPCSSATHPWECLAFPVTVTNCSDKSNLRARKGNCDSDQESSARQVPLFEYEFSPSLWHCSGVFLQCWRGWNLGGRDGPLEVGFWGLFMAQAHFEFHPLLLDQVIMQRLPTPALTANTFPTMVDWTCPKTVSKQNFSSFKLFLSGILSQWHKSDLQ